MFDKRAGKGVAKAVEKARRLAADEDTPIRSLLAVLEQVIGKCGSPIRDGCEGIAAEAMIVTALACLRVAEERLVVTVVRHSATGPRLEEAKMSRMPSWPGLADRASLLAERAGVATSAVPEPRLRALLDAVVNRARELGSEHIGKPTREVEHIAYSSGIYAPPDFDGPAYLSIPLSGVTSGDLHTYARGFPNTESLLIWSNTAV